MLWTRPCALGIVRLATGGVGSRAWVRRAVVRGFFAGPGSRARAMVFLVGRDVRRGGGRKRGLCGLPLAMGRDRGGIVPALE